MAIQYLKLENIIAYKIASDLSDEIWDEVCQWSWFEKRTIGIQLTRAIDSIAANIAEGFGRYHKKDKIKFYFNARASVFESAHWIKKAKVRKIIIEEKYNKYIIVLRKLPKEINTLIKITQEKLKQ